MTALIHYAAGYILDFFRERVSEDDFADEEVTRVAVPAHLDEESLHRLRRLFPAAEFRSAGPRTDLWRVRRLRFDVACIPMRGRHIRWRFLAVLSGARHKLLLPAPDYVYRLGMRRGAAELFWALIDRFVLAPVALVWLGVLGIAAYGSGLVRRARPARPARATWRPRRVVLLRLMPTRNLVALLKRIRRDFGGVYLAAVLASEEGRTELQRVSNEVVSPRTGGIGGIIRIMRAGRFDTVILAGGEDYGLRPSYLKAAALALLAPGAARYRWEIGDSLPGIPLRKAVARSLRGRRSRGRRPGPLGRIRLRRRYGKEPTRGPSMAQIGITKGCNYHCLFCAFHSPAAERGHRDADLPRMSFESFARVLGHLKSMGTTAIDICGDGEPLMHPEALDMIELARELGFDVTLATNAALLTEAGARRLVDLGLRRMHVSFNAATDDVYQELHAGAPPGARRRILTRLREMAEYAEREGRRPIEVEFSAVLNRLNMQQIPQMVEAAHEAHAGWFMLILMGPVEGAEDLLPRPEDWILIQRDIDRAAARASQLGIHTNLESIRPGATPAGTRSVYEKVPCHIGHEYVLITADGSVMFCCQCTRPLGTMNEDSFRDIWYSEAYRQARRQAEELPRTGKALPGCECFTACSHVVVNLEVYRKLYGERALRSVL